MSRHSALPSPSGPPSKIAIPRLERRRDPPAQAGVSSKQRVSRACLSCRARKIKCNGLLPRCSNCYENASPCVYASSRKDRLKTATETNRDLISLLEGLREHVSDTDKRKIEEMLSRVLDDVADATAAVDKSPEKVKSPELELEEGEANVSAEVGSNEELAMMDENLLETEQSRATGFMGKNSEVQWLRHVHYAADQKNASSPRERSEGPYGPPGKSTEAATARVDAMKRRQDKTGPLMHTSSCSFYMDDEDVRMDFMVEALDLPPFETAERLLKCYMGAVHNSFPLLAKKTFVNQFYHYYASVGRRQPYKLPQKWQAILNMVFAIGAVYSHLIEADWQADDRDHLLYHSRAWSLSLKDPWWFSHPDLAQMQTMGLLALYYLSIGHVNRSWIVIGMSLRGGCALGLHMRNEDRNASVEKKEILGRIWWGLYSLERILSAITGRPSVGMESDCSVPLPLPLSTDEINGAIIASRFGPQSAVYFAQEHIRSEPNAASSSSIRMLTDTEKSSNEPTNSGSYLKHAVTMGMINQRTLVALYAPSVASKSWQTVQKDIAELDEDLDAWSASLPLGLNFLQHEEEHQYTQERNALALHYYSTKILITRPCVCRLDRRIPDQTQKSRNFNQHIAETCIGAAKAISDLLPDDFQHQRVMLYKMGPWWILVHYIMQALAVLMLEVSYEAVNFPRDRHDMVPSIKKLVRWLRHTRSNNRMAGRAYDIVLQLLHKLTLKINIDISDLISEDAADAPQSPMFPNIPLKSTSTPHSNSPPQTSSRTDLYNNHPMTDAQDQPPLAGIPHDDLQNLVPGQLNSGSTITNLFLTTFDEENPLPVTDSHDFDLASYEEPQWGNRRGWKDG